MRRWTRGLLVCTAIVLAAVPAWALSPFAIWFESGSARVGPAFNVVLDNIIAQVGVLDVREILIVGATDRVGSEQANLALSRRRAEAVRDALLARGMSRHVRVRIIADGETRPLVQTGDGVAEPQNRSAMIVLHEMCVDWFHGGRRRTEGECAAPLSA